MTPSQKRIERAYQRAMNIRDSTPGRVGLRIEDWYMNAYLRAYKRSDAASFRVKTRKYLRDVRKAGSRA